MLANLTRIGADRATIISNAASSVESHESLWGEEDGKLGENFGRENTFAEKRKRVKSMINVRAETFKSMIPNLRKGLIDNRYASQIIKYHRRKGDLLISTDSWQRRNFDLLVILALVYTATITPYDVGFNKVNIGVSSPLTTVNRIIDILFIIDIFATFCTPVFVHGAWITNHKAIAWRYATGWLVIDVAAAIPFELLAVSGDGKLRDYSLIRVIRLTRLAKILRVFRATRLLERAQVNYALNHAQISVIKYILIIIIMSHWLACLFGISEALTLSAEHCVNSTWVDMDSVEDTWVKVYFGEELGFENYCSISPSSKYLGALYWSVMTVTTIGYGDIVPRHDGERALIILGMLVGAALYAYIVGVVCGTLASMDNLSATFIQKIDDLNKFMSIAELPNDLRIELRRYFYYTEGLQRNRYYQRLLHDMSPELRGKVALVLNLNWIEKIPFVAKSPIGEQAVFVRCLALELTHLAFPPNEMIIKASNLCNELMILGRGVAIKHGTSLQPPLEGGSQRIRSIMGKLFASATQQIFVAGQCIGLDFILTNHRRRYSVLSASYLDVHVLTKPALMRILKENHLPMTKKALRLYSVKLAFRIKFVQFARMERAKRRAELLHKKGSGSKSLRNVRISTSLRNLNPLEKRESDGVEDESPSRGTSGEDTVAILQQVLGALAKNAQKLESIEKRLLKLE